MGFIKDIREYKNNLRNRYKSERRKMPISEKLNKDQDIAKRLLKINQYSFCETVLVYVSTEIEVDTKNLIKMIWADGKKVAVPYCVPNTRNMEFYYITSFDELSPGSFGVLEPEPNKENEFNPDDKSICIVPGLCFDNFGYRLGYGKGYYDRFLANYHGLTIGICYSSYIRGNLQHGKYDFSVDLVVTENKIINTALQNKNKKFRV